MSQRSCLQSPLPSDALENTNKFNGSRGIQLSLFESENHAEPNHRQKRLSLFDARGETHGLSLWS